MKTFTKFIKISKPPLLIIKIYKQCVNMYIQFCAEEDMCFSNNRIIRLFRIESRKY